MTKAEIAQQTGLEAPSEVRMPPRFQGDQVQWVPFDPAMELPDGTQFRFKTASGVYEYTIQPDGSFAPSAAPKQTTTKTSPKLEMSTGGTPIQRQQAILDKAQERYNDPATPETEKSGLLALINQAETRIHTLGQDTKREGATAADQAKKDAATKANDTALAASAVAKRQAGLQPTQAEAEAFFKVHGGAQAQGQYTMPIQGYSGPIGPHHAGYEKGAVDLFAPPGSPVVAATGGTIVRAGPYGAAGNNVVILGADGKTYDYEHIDNLSVKPGDKVTSGQPLAVVATTERGGSSVGPQAHLHFAVSNSSNGINYDNHGTSEDFDTLSFVQSLAAGHPPNGPAGASLFGPPKPEIHPMGKQLVRYDPATGKTDVIYDASTLDVPAHFTVQSGGRNVVMQWDPATKQWKQSFIGDLSPTEQAAQKGKIQTLLEQADSTRAYVKEQYNQGLLTMDQMNKYGDMLNDYVDAAMQGTTPYERYKFAEEQARLKETTAKGLLEKQVETTSQMAMGMLGQGVKGLTDSKYGQIAPGSLFGLFQGGLDAATAQTKPLSDLAQQLLASVGTKAAGAGLNPRVDVLTGQTPSPSPAAVQPDGMYPEVNPGNPVAA